MLLLLWFALFGAGGEESGGPTVPPGSGNLYWKIYRKRRG